jgi:hypothetical protein
VTLSPPDLAALILRTITRALAPRDTRLAAVEGRLEALQLGPVLERLAAAEARLAAADRAVELLGTVRERVAGLEARPPVAGPPGPAGADGLGVEDFEAALDGHVLTLGLKHGDRVTTRAILVPFLRDCGVYREGAGYEPGDVVTWGGSLWACQLATLAKPGTVASAAAWRLIVKCGRDGKDGKDGARGPAGPTGKSAAQLFDEARAR